MFYKTKVRFSNVVVNHWISIFLSLKSKEIQPPLVFICNILRYNIRYNIRYLLNPKNTYHKELL